MLRFFNGPIIHLCIHTRPSSFTLSMKVNCRDDLHGVGTPVVPGVPARGRAGTGSLAAWPGISTVASFAVERWKPLGRLAVV